MSDEAKTLDPAIKAAVAGDNSNKVPEDFRIVVTPPEDILPFLGKNYDELAKRYAELMVSYEKMPEAIADKDTSGKAGDLVKEMRLLEGKLDSARTIENEPFSKGKSAIDGFFKNMMAPLEKAKKAVLERNTAYLNKVKREETDRIERAAQAKREEEEKLRREAALAEERRVAADEAQRTAEAAAQEARDNKDELEQGRLDAEAALANAKLKKAKGRRDRDEETFNAASAEVEQCFSRLSKAKEDLRNARTAQRIAAEEAERLARRTRDAANEHKTLSGDAQVAGGQAQKLERKLETASDGELASNRSDHGTVSTLARRWTHHIEDMVLVQQNAQMYIGLIDPEAIRVAIGKRAATGNRDVPGVIYEQVSDARAL